jgi:hypothetical protein
VDVLILNMHGMNNVNCRNFRTCLTAETSVSREYEKRKAREELTDVRRNLTAGKILHQ